jgi:hypothetical protein
MFQNPTLLMQYLSFSHQIDLLKDILIIYLEREREREGFREMMFVGVKKFRSNLEWR